MNLCLYYPECIENGTLSLLATVLLFMSLTLKGRSNNFCTAWIQIVALLAEGREKGHTWDVCTSAWVARQCTTQPQWWFLGCHSCSSHYWWHVFWYVSMVAISCSSLPDPSKVPVQAFHWTSSCHGYSLWPWWQHEGSLRRSDRRGGAICEWSWRAWWKTLSWVSSATSACCLYNTHIFWFLSIFVCLPNQWPSLVCSNNKLT